MNSQSMPLVFASAATILFFCNIKIWNRHLPRHHQCPRKRPRYQIQVSSPLVPLQHRHLLWIHLLWYLVRPVRLTQIYRRNLWKILCMRDWDRAVPHCLAISNLQKLLRVPQVPPSPMLWGLDLVHQYRIQVISLLSPDFRNVHDQCYWAIPLRLTWICRRKNPWKESLTFKHASCPSLMF